MDIFWNYTFLSFLALIHEQLGLGDNRNRESTQVKKFNLNSILTCNIYPTAATMLSFLHNYTILDVYLTTDFIQMITQLQNLQVMSECQSHACHMKYFNYVNRNLQIMQSQLAYITSIIYFSPFKFVKCNKTPGLISICYTWNFASEITPQISPFFSQSNTQAH